MRLIRGLHNLRPQDKGCALAIGNFDGLHRGHLELLARARAHATKASVPPAAMIFEPMPREFFAPAQPPPRICEFHDKLRRFEQAGMERVYCLHFDARLAGMSAESFIDDVLFDRIGVRAVVVGDDFRFGKGRRGDSAMLRERLGPHLIPVDVVGAILSGDERCSSTAIRDALGAADLARAERLLGRPYSMIGRVRHGRKLGRKLGMPTLNFVLRHAPALRLGVYAVCARERGKSAWLPGVASLGVRPTIGGTAPLLEVHLFDNGDDWYGREVEVEFRHFLRTEVRFESLDALAAQMQADAAQARQLLASRD
jgi:riboflavin kinase/FMN adenylyltransferase